MAAMIPAVLIYANCQGEELCETGRYMPSLAGRLNFKWIPFHLVTEEDWNTRFGPGFMADVVTVWEQMETGGVSPNRAAFHARIPNGCPVVRFPPFTASCLWPFAGNDPRAAVDPERYPWPDSIAAVLSSEDLSDDDITLGLFRGHSAGSTSLLLCLLSPFLLLCCCLRKQRC